MYFQWILDFFEWPSSWTLAHWILLFYTAFFVIIIAFLVRRTRAKSREIPAGVTKILASVGDTSGGIASAKRLKFIKAPSDALVFLKIEENAIQQALAAVDYYANNGEIESPIKDGLTRIYQDRLEAVRAAIAKDTELREAVETSSAVDKARSDYLRKLAAMSGTVVEADGTAAGPTSVGMPGKAGSGKAAPSAGPPSGGAPGGGVPTGGPPSGGAPSGGPPSGGRPAGGPPSGGAPSGVVPTGGPPGGGAPSGGAPSGVVPTGGPPGGGAPSGGPPGGGPPSGGPTSGGTPSATLSARPPGMATTPSVSTPTPSTTPPTPGPGPSSGGPRSSLQNEMLAEMERLKALMSGD
jgi:hypothetical protein